MMTLLIVLIVVFGLLILELIRLIIRLRRYDGAIVYRDTTRKLQYSLELDSDPEFWSKQKRVVLQVRAYSDVGNREEN